VRAKHNHINEELEKDFVQGTETLLCRVQKHKLRNELLETNFSPMCQKKVTASLFPNLTDMLAKQCKRIV
jgi:hypothetical protein